MASPATRHLTILLTDIKGFTDKTSSKSREAISTMLDEHRAVVLPLLEARGGHLVKTIGDAFLMTFESPTNAVLAGVSVQEALAKLNEGRAADDRLEIRIAINSGEVNLMDNDVFGEAVNITARIEGIAAAGEVWFTEAVYLAMNKAEVPSSEIGLMQLKGIPEKIRVYKVRREEPVGASSAKAAARATSLFGLLPQSKAALVGAGPLPSTWRRAAALAIDGALCALLVGVIVGGGAKIRVKKADAARANVSFDAGVGRKPVAVKTASADVAYDGKNGLRVDVDEDRGRGGRDWGFALAWIAYNLVFLKKFGATPGKKMMKLRVVAMDGRELDFRQQVTRSGVSLISGYAVGLGYLWALWEPHKRGWHDLLADTRVVTAE